MRKSKNIFSFIVVLFSSALFLGGCGFEKTGIEIASQPIAKVYIDGKESGMTPYKNNSMEARKIDVRLDDGKGGIWEREIGLESNVTTVINWSFGDKINGGFGYILSMEKNGDKGSILVNSVPGGSSIRIDGEIKNNSPAIIEGIGEGDIKVSVSYPGYKSVNLIVKMVKGYRMVIDTKLQKEESITNIENVETTINQRTTKILIKETGTGWLRVRESADSNAKEISRVTPGESYDMVSEDVDWYQIKIGETFGWISTKFGEKISE
ncbi:PEGA domain-containing protein [Patescibacteria group bacterium]|nr:PEGA domain-containing protein [Patescibacteria group bacterium]